MPRALLIQLARLGDLVQSLPVITSLSTLHPERPLDLLCPGPLSTLGRLFPGISKVYSWDGAIWQLDSLEAGESWKEQLWQMKKVWAEQAFPAYSLVYNLNNHPRSILAGHLLADQVMGPGAWGPVNPRLSAWGEYLRTVAKYRGSNRVHLSDALCGLCGVRPPRHKANLCPIETELPMGLECLRDSSRRPIIGLVLGAGDPERRIPVAVWSALIQECVAAFPDALMVCIGGKEEREIAFTLENLLPSACCNRVIDICGKTSLFQLVGVLRQCQWVVGSDTGPLHMGTVCGARVVGWYFARARVHETGPYGAGHYVWQYTHEGDSDSQKVAVRPPSSGMPRVWPVRETVRVFLGNPQFSSSGPWSLWTSRHDELGTFYQGHDNSDEGHHTRRTVWDDLSPGLAHLVP